MKVQKILLSRIDCQTEGWDFFIIDKQPIHVPRLAESLQRVGQIYPLILRKDMDWLFFICGWPKYQAMKQLGVEEAWARIYQKNELSDEEALWISLEDYCRGGFPPLKQKVILEKFVSIGYTREKLAKTVAPAIGIETSLEAVGKILQA